MKKSTKTLIRQKIAIILIVLMSINTFAAVVGDNVPSNQLTDIRVKQSEYHHLLKFPHKK